MIGKLSVLLVMMSLFGAIVLADTAELKFEEKNLVLGNPQTVTVTVSKTLFEMTDVDLELSIEGPAYFENGERKTAQHYDTISRTQEDQFTLYLDEEYDGVYGEINVTYKLTYDTRTGPHIEKGQGSFQGIWTEQGDCTKKLNLCRAALEQKTSTTEEAITEAGLSTPWALILCALTFLLGGFLGYKITHHFFEKPKKE